VAERDLSINQELPQTINILNVWVDDSGGLWAVILVGDGRLELAHRPDGGTWRSLWSGPAATGLDLTVLAIWGIRVSENEAHVYFSNGTTMLRGIFMRDSESFEVSEYEAGTAITQIDGSSPTDVVIASFENWYHFDGQEMSPLAFPDAESILAVATAGSRILVHADGSGDKMELSWYSRTIPWSGFQDSETSCENGLDDDGDGFVDGLDTECQ
jgi:hypothetical protein